MWDNHGGVGGAQYTVFLRGVVVAVVCPSSAIRRYMCTVNRKCSSLYAYSMYRSMDIVTSMIVLILICMCSHPKVELLGGLIGRGGE